MATSTKTTRKRSVGGATHDVQQDLQVLRDDLGTLAEEVASLMSSTGNQALDEMKDRIRRVRQNLDEVVSAAGTRGRDALLDVTENMSGVIEQSLKERPLTTLALAVGLGFVLGATWRK
jgi:ElaB/YqjD/DUF883 family membrane-anchored ribosome-binding protein